MPRHAKHRSVCGMPRCCRFYSSDKHDINMEPVCMTVEEYETIRLIDYVGSTQEECAKQMNVARTTVQRIYNDARRKLSVFLVQGTELQIAGGSYELCNRQHCDCQRKMCKCKNHLMERED